MITINVDGVTSVAVEKSMLVQLLTRNVRYFRIELAQGQWSEEDISHINYKIDMYEEMLKNVNELP